ncbi:hypothetical protein FEK30_01155 (plasmid) [Picosynechococcus sp. PCC 11901]|uniref:hypothetical protein n=1 Tax=Picosynechococcus sp. PCC 11901 TaxID=2579791 RepID=UPI0010FC0000|nr:hypothetical protein [Picosynechococcus sp. PCC 11901]QCS48152.1 hypothetical protein FEK30_01155 [Picosynechococcus sp. PCC 11901]
MFTRREAQNLTGLSNNQIQGLINYGIIKPYKIADYETARSYYDFEMILEMRAIKRLKEQAKESKSRVTFNMIKDAMKSLVSMGLDDSLRSKEGYVILFENKNIVFKSEKETLKMFISGKNKYQLFLMVDDLIEDVEKLAMKNKVKDFERKRNSKSVQLVA